MSTQGIQEIEEYPREDRWDGGQGEPKNHTWKAQIFTVILNFQLLAHIISSKYIL